MNFTPLTGFKLHPKTLRRLNRLGEVLLFLISLITISAIVIDYGFELYVGEQLLIQQIYKAAWWCYLFTYLGRLVFQWRKITRKAVFMTAFTGLMLLLTALPKLFDLGPKTAWLTPLWELMQSQMVLILIIGFFALMEFAKGVMTFINRKTNPALLLASAFLVIILFGALLLLLPRSTHEGIVLPVVDALFISTSAVCVTGLATVDIAQTFTTEGQIIIALLIQIGGLGVMTITSFFALFFMGGTGLYNQFALRDMVGSDTFSSLISTLLYILGFTFAIEAIGAGCIWLSIHGTMGMTLHEELFFSVFHAISAFCNAGFSTQTGNLGSPLVFDGHIGFYLIISLLIILGGIGFPILVNLKQLLAYYLRRGFHHLFRREGVVPRFNHLTNVNTKIVLRTTLLLVVGSAALIALLEWEGAFAAMPTGEKLTHALFNAVVPRTAGFNSVDLTHFSLLTLLLYMLLMWIGGASQSTAGGIKVNTFAVAMANLVAVVRGRESVTLLGREISNNSVHRALAVLFGSLLTILIFFVTLLLFEPGLSPLGLLFETISAIGTVGSSLNITPLLSTESRVAIILLMFIGRVGLITVLMSFVGHNERPKYRLPKENIIIN